MYGYHHLPSTSDSCGPSFHLATTFGTAIWTTRHVGSLFSTNCVYFYNTAKIWPYELQGHILDDFEHSKIYSPSMLYAPFIFTIDSLRWCELTLQICLKTIRGIESKTGHGSWVPISKLTIEDIEQLTGTLGTSLNVICNIHRHANIIESVWEHHKELSGELLAVSGCDKVHAIDKTIISAIEVFQQELANTRIQAQFLEQRVRSQTSVLFNLLSHEHAKASDGHAKASNASAMASRELAAAARRDGSSMKTVAVLTMAFLPATFFATFFAIPSLAWSSPDKFVLYFVFTIPATVVTFVLWAGITQRASLRRIFLVVTSGFCNAAPETPIAQAQLVDPAILDTLGLPGQSTTMVPHGESNIANTFKLSSTVGGQEFHYFVKTSSNKDADIMFKGEHTSLNMISSVVPNLCPKSYAHGPLRASGGFFLAIEFLDTCLPPKNPPSARNLARKLARMHRTQAPVPEGYDIPMFGFPVPTFCGATVQDNSWKSSWAEFYADNRLRAILHVCMLANGSDPELALAVEKTATAVVTRLLGNDIIAGSIIPVIVHGDLHFYNTSHGIMAGSGDLEEVVYDPSCVYGHSEYDLGMMSIYSDSYGTDFWQEYHSLVPKAEPKEEWRDRVCLYRLYYILNFFAVHRENKAENRKEAMDIMRFLISKYSDSN
ncbi:conserved hypothetical protein [Aspergillus terreus NIH2624]|uniref:protein-ribulosamine 3-kinase n=1 Tax=Aspergillus terreus (strain NIH 2624 / FGSC A1156) TaxID=341663 RepID=Q0C8Q9_ASPTN|nr:uncharacterized protein ATEG_09925 [Aspergillus terreus NIH2624]EAU30116.1 conserved hypothetical protein [Aspergillus terreus NIH2624]